MSIAGKNTARKRLLPAFLALVFMLLSIPQVALAADFSAVIVSDSMSIYADPSLTKKVGALGKDDVVVVTKHKDGVAYITYRANGNKGYARVSDMQAVTDVAEKVTVTTNAKFYKKANSSSASKKVNKGTAVYVLATNGKWARVEYAGYVGFMYIDALSIGTPPAETPTPTAAPTATPAPTAAANPLAGFTKISKKAVAVADDIPVYELPDASSKKLGTLDKGATVGVAGMNKDWAYITLNGNNGFAPLAALLPDPPVTTGSSSMVAKSATSLHRTAMSASEKVASIAKGDALEMHAYNKSWAFVTTSGGASGYVPTNKITLAPSAQTPAPTAAPTPAPTAEGPVIPPGNGVIVETAPVVTNAKVTIYKSASTSSAKLGTLNKNAQMTMLARSKNWAYVTLDGKYGYCALAALTRADQAPTPTPTPTPTPAPSETPSLDNAIPATVTVASATVYSSASASAKKLGTIKAGQQVNLLVHNNSWAYIEMNGKYGYCQLKALTPTADLKPTPSPTPGNGNVLFEATVVYPNAPVYSSESATTETQKLAIGTVVSVYAYDNKAGWAYVGKGDARGFMQIKHLNKDGETALSPGSSGNGVLALQKALEALGYFDGVPAGNYNTLTEQAVSRFQSAVGMQATGSADINTLRVLASGNAPSSPLLSMTLSSGSSGGNVERLQMRLYNKGYLTKTSSVDGSYGSTTASAVKLFQSTAGISASGTADSKTLKALYSPNAPKNTKAAPDAGGNTGGGDDDVSSDTDKLPANPTRAQKIEYVIYVGQQQLGKPYVYGATGPNSFDCSGFTTYCYKKVGVSMGRTAYAQGYSAGTKIEGLSNLQRGDIVAMDTVSDSDLSDHVGIYLGNSKFIHASSGGGKVMISSLSSGYYNRVFSWGRRVL